MGKKYFIAILGLFLTLSIIFLVTLFNQQRYYDIQEKNRLTSFNLLLNSKSETNKVCLKYASQAECYKNFINSLEQLNPRGVVQLSNNQNKILHTWDNENHKDDRTSVSTSRIFSEFDSQPTVTLSKLTRHQNLYKSSLNAMFFSVFNYTEEFKAKLSGQPSTFGDLTPYTFAKYIAWGRFYPILPIWIIAIFLFGYIISLLFKNISFNNSIKNLQGKIENKESLLNTIQSESFKIRKSSDDLQVEMAKKLENLNIEKNSYGEKVIQLELKLKALSDEKALLINKIIETENLNSLNAIESKNFYNQLVAQKQIFDELNLKKSSLESDITTHISDKEEYKDQLEMAKIKLHELEKLHNQSKSQEASLMSTLDNLQGNLNKLNNQLNDSVTIKDNVIHDLNDKEKELKEYLAYALEMENDHKALIEDKDLEVERLKLVITELQTQKDNAQYELDTLSGVDAAPRKIYNILVSNPDLPKSQNYELIEYEYSESRHHSKAYVKSIDDSFKRQKNNKIGNLITDLRGTKFNSKTPNTLKIVENYAINSDIARSGFGLVAIEKTNGYGAYMHLTARNSSEAMLAAKAIQTYCSVFKGYRILPLSVKN